MRELKAHTSKILREVSEKRKEYIITRHGKPFGKLVPVEEYEKKREKVLRGSYRNLPDLTEKDFEQTKTLWKPKQAES